MTITRTAGARKAHDELITDLFLFDMTDRELRELANCLHVSFEAISQRAATARKNRQEQLSAHWEGF